MSDSVCLPDYLKVSLLHRANRSTLFCPGPCALLYTTVLTNYRVIVPSHSVRLLTSFLKILDRDWSFESDRTSSLLYFHARKDKLNFRKIFLKNSSCLKFHSVRCSLLPNWHSFAPLSFPNFSLFIIQASTFSSTAVIKYHT